MRLRFAIALILTLLLATGIKVTEIQDAFTVDNQIGVITYEAACRISRYEVCPPIPQVRRSPILGELMEARGAYWPGGTVVWLDDLFPKGTQRWLTIFHEQIHYIQEANYVFTQWDDDSDTDLRCLIEREALTFTNEYALELNAPYLLRSIETWRSLYTGCSPDLTENRFMHRKKSWLN